MVSCVLRKPRARSGQPVNVDLSMFVDEVAERVAVRLAADLEASSSAGEPWRLLTVAETGDRLGRSTRWVRERAKRGDLPFVKLDGGALAFDLEDVQNFVRERRIACSPLAGSSNTPIPSGDATRRLRAVQKVKSDRRVAK